MSVLVKDLVGVFDQDCQIMMSDNEEDSWIYPAIFIPSRFWERKINNLEANNNIIIITLEKEND